jgi:DNA (cytosine-5)-methyltransferase 1
MTASVPRGDSDRQPQPKPFTVGSLFSGIGGIDLAFAAAGFDVRWQVEIDPYCRAVLAKHAPHYWPNAEQHADIYDCHDLPHVDVVVAGFPCQPFSLAGKRLGVNDDRYLVPELFRVIEEVRPYAALFENVPGFTSIDDGNTFADFLRALAEMGYDAEWGRLSAAGVGAPHKRERWIGVAYRDSAGMEGRTQAGNAGGGRAQANQLPVRRNTSRSRRMRLNRTTQPRLGGTATRLSNWLDGHQWPAGLGQPQHDYEPPRVITGAKNRTARIKALGNAVVPQVILPLAAAVREFLDVRAEEGGAE